ncbi:STAS-like domain-containing protein [Thermoanaerobacterium thermosaccharolyticum]
MMFPLNVFGDLLLGRELGKKVRNSIEEILQSNENIIIDFTGINGTSQSFADELFGTLIEEMGLDKFKKKIKTKNANPEVQSIIKHVLINRLEKLNSYCQM